MQVIFSKIFLSFGNTGWIPSTSRVTPVLLEDIHKVTGLYFLDSLLFTGPSGYEFVYSLTIILLFIAFLSGAFNLQRSLVEDSSKYTSKLVIQLIAIFLVSISSLLISMYFNFESILIFNIFPLLTFTIKLIIFFSSWAVWIYLFYLIDVEKRKYFLKPIKISLGITFLVVLFYLVQGWFGFSIYGDLYTTRPTITLFQNVASHLLLPSLALGMLISGVIARLVRMNMINTLDEQYIDASKARGIDERIITYKYALKNATVTSIPLIGLQFALLLGGAILTETTFSFEGLGRYIFQALQRKDYPQIQASIILFAVIVSILSIITDIIYALFDPRIRL
jgi:ABC-type dipeptide/oligopeptide/nickel transport system permease component